MSTRNDLIQAHMRGVGRAFLVGLALNAQATNQPPANPPPGATAPPAGTPVTNGLSEAEVIQGIQQGITTGLQTLNTPIIELRRALNQGLAEVGRRVDRLGDQIEGAAFGGDDQATPILRQLREGQTQMAGQVAATNQGVQDLTTTVQGLAAQVTGLSGRVVQLEGRREVHAARRNIQSALAQRLRRENIRYELDAMPRLAAEIESGRATEDQVVERLRAAAPPAPAPAPAPPPAPAPAPPPPMPEARPAPAPASHPRIIPAPVRPAPAARNRNEVANGLAEQLDIPPYGMLNEALIDAAMAAPDIPAFVAERLADAKARITGRMATIDAARAADEPWIDRTSRLWLGVPVQEDNELEGFLQLRVSEG